MSVFYTTLNLFLKGPKEICETRKDRIFYNGKCYFLSAGRVLRAADALSACVKVGGAEAAVAELRDMPTLRAVSNFFRGHINNVHENFHIGGTYNVSLNFEIPQCTK